jgi:hypothetical protein
MPSEIYCCWIEGGSPAHLVGLHRGIYITEVNSTPVHTLVEFIYELKKVEKTYVIPKTAQEALDRPEYVRLKTKRFDRGTEKVIAVRPDPHYWSTTTWTRPGKGTQLEVYPVRSLTA